MKGAQHTSPDRMCDSVLGIVSYIQEQAGVLATFLQTRYDLADIMDKVINMKVDTSTTTALHNILHTNPLVGTAVYNRKIAILLKCEESYKREEGWKKDALPFKETETYKKAIANRKLLEKLFTNHDFLKNGEYSFMSRAIAENEFRRRIIEGLLQYDKLGPWGEGDLPAGQRYGWRDKKKYSLTINENTGNVTEFEVPIEATAEENPTDETGAKE